MATSLEQRKQSVMTSSWALEQFQKIRPYLNQDDRDFIESLLDADAGREQRMREPGKVRGPRVEKEE